MSLLPFDPLPPFKPRQFVPVTLDPGNWQQIEPLFDRLESGIAAVGNAGDLESWLLAWNELTSAVGEEGSRRFIAMCCNTGDPAAEKSYLDFVTNIDPHLKSRQFRLEKLFIACSQLAGLSSPDYDVLIRGIRNSVELFREENIPLEVEEQLLAQQYQKLSGAQTVLFRGEEKTVDAMALFLEEPDRALRQEAWDLIAARRLQDADKVEEIFERLLDLRTRIARNAGFEDYRDYAFRRLGRFDYTAADCLEFHASIEQAVVPALKNLQARRSEQLGLSPLRPWDGAVDPLGRPPLRPFKDVAGLVAGSQRVFDQLDSGLGAGFQLMQDQRLLDLANREGKAPGGFQTALREARLPFIFMNAVGQQRDVETILHEAGHAFHTLAARDLDLDAYRSAPIEFCEVASMSMELLGNEFIEEFYPPAEASRARRKHLEGIVRILTWVPVVDAFQHWVYTHPGHSRTERSAEWIRLLDRFGDVDWSGLEEQRAASWHRVLHLFVVPFYFVEYGIAQLGALQVWANSKRDKAGAMSDYKAALALGGSRPLPELFAAAGCRFRFDQATIAPLVEMLEAELRLLGDSQ